MFEYLKGKRVLVTGGCGTVGHELAKRLAAAGVEAHAVFSRNEAAQFKLQQLYPHVKCYWGDVRIKRELDKVFMDFQPDVVIHAAAVKVVPTAEHEMLNTFEINALGTYNVAMACLENGVEVACTIGTDKQCAPVNVYGMTKHIATSIFSDCNRLGKTRFVSTRYGNVLCSRSSLGVIMMDQARKGQDLTVTDPTMTRFFFTIQEGVRLIDFALEHAYLTKDNVYYGETFSTQMCAVELRDLFEVVADKFNVRVKTIGRRAGEKTHENLMAEYELKDTLILYNYGYKPHYAPQYTLYPYCTTPHLREKYPISDSDKQPSIVFSSDMAPRLTKPEIWDILSYAYETTWKD